MTLFNELLRVALGHQQVLSRNPSDKEWRELFDTAVHQTVVGVTFEALDHLSAQGQKLPVDLLYEWIGANEQIKKQNLLLNKRCSEITHYFSEVGFRSCILKGQGNAATYPNPLSRTSGDIDVWLEGSKEEIHKFVRSRYPNAKDEVLHFDFPVFKDVPVEVHYKPQYLSCPKYDRRMQKFFQGISKEQFNNQITIEGTGETFCIPTPEFNLIQQLAHIIGHFFHGGIGMRQIVDYYYVLKALDVKANHRDYAELLDYLGLLKFSSGLMWVMQEVLGMDDKYLVAIPSKEIGLVILNEIDAGGNFGRYKEKKYSLKGRTLLGKGYVFAKRQYRMASIYPMEAWWQIIDVFIHVTNKYVLKRI